MSHSQQQFLSALGRGFLTIFLLVGLCVGFAFLGPDRATAQESASDVANPSGFPLPRFVSLRSKPINVRVGPGTRYDIAWVFVKSGLPVEVVQEFDIWRKIRDLDGQEGWIHKSLLIGTRTAYVAPWIEAGDSVPLRARRRADSNVRAKLGPRVLVTVETCDGSACKITTRPSGSSTQTYTGFVAQDALWGVYANEIIE